MEDRSKNQVSSIENVNCALLPFSKPGSLRPLSYRRNEVCLLLTGFILCLLLLASSASAQDRPSEEARHKELPNFGRVNERLYRGGQPQKGGIQKLASLGVNTIINLRDDDQRALAEEKEATSQGLRYFNIPFKTLGRPSDVQIDRVLSLIDATEHGIVFVHCHKGQDRTGTVIAVYRISHDGWTGQKATEEANRFGMKFWQRGMKDYISDYYRTRSPRTNEPKETPPIRVPGWTSTQFSALLERLRRRQHRLVGDRRHLAN